jgi:glycosyltransferase involved in cell wall biosynthesis
MPVSVPRRPQSALSRVCNGLSVLAPRKRRRCAPLIRLAYVSGPIDARRVYDDWQRGDQSAYYGTIYLVQLYALLHELGVKGLIITTLGTDSWADTRGNFRIVNLPTPKSKAGLSYHVAMLGWVARCLSEIFRFGANAALLTAGQNYLWAFGLLRLRGIRLIVSLHCTLWPKHARRKPIHRLFDVLNGRLLFPICDHIQGVSDEAVEQVRSVAPSLRRQPQRFIATYESGRFSDVQPAVWPANGVFELLYVGRLTANKGVFDLVHTMELLQEREPGRFRLTVCGSGPAADALVSRVRGAGLDDVVEFRGQCATPELERLFRKAHAVVVPTRSDFEEGTPKVAFEAVLNMRPLVMSAACPALADVRLAVEEAAVDDPRDYAAAIESLSRDPLLYDERVRGTLTARTKHFDETRSYGMTLRPVLERMKAASLGSK